mgnify:CR=1 FL=1
MSERADSSREGRSRRPPPIGLIAAGGELPLATARGIRRAGRTVGCVALAGQCDPTLRAHCDRFRRVGLIQLGKWIRTLRRWGCDEAVMVGKVQKTRMYDPMVWMRYRPDLRAGKIWFVRLRADKRADRMLGAVAEEMERSGVSMVDSTRYIPELLAEDGLMTRREPTPSQWADIRFALPIVRQLGGLDIGQSVAVHDRDVVAVEAIEGTDAMIERAGGLCRRGGWTLVKLAKPEQDMRFDVPTVGPRTIEMMRLHGGRCLAVEAGRTILLDKPNLLYSADAAGIAVVGLGVEDRVP